MISITQIQVFKGSVLLPILSLFLVSAQEPLAFPEATPESQGLTASALEDIAATVQEVVDSGVVMGAELLVIKNRQTVLHRVYGWRDKELELPMVPDTIFNIRSMTKPLTGAALQILIDEGKVEIDAPVSTYLPGFRNQKSGSITVEQLLTHRSGIPGTILKSMTDYPDLISMGNAVGEHGPKFEPGSKFWYSDSATDAVGALVSQVSGLPLDDFIRTRLLEPLGMSDTLYAPTGEDARWQRVASLYLGNSNQWIRFWTPRDEAFYPYPWGAQSIYSTPRDYAKFLALWMDGGMVKERHILSADAIQRTLKPVSVMSQPESDSPMPTGFQDLEVWYGQMAMLHVSVEEDANTPKVVIVGHGGSDGTRAWAWPKEDLMVLYFTQTRGQTTSLVLEGQMHKQLYADTAEVQIVPESFKPYLGTYVANYDRYKDVEFSILYEDGHLVMDVPLVMAFKLKPADATGQWALAGIPGVAVSFDRDAQGEITTMKVHKPGVVHNLPKGRAKVKVTVQLKEEQLRKYLGFFRDEKEGVSVQMVFQNGTLAVCLPDVPAPLEFFPPDEDNYWVLKMNPAIKVRFVTNPGGEVVSCVMNSNGVVSIHPRLPD
jgi:CubicO group peptidase (beta-lactamase class C family)